MVDRSRTNVVTDGCGQIGSFVVCKFLRRSVNCVIIVYDSSTYTFDQESFFCEDVLKEIFKNSIFT